MNFQVSVVRRTMLAALVVTAAPFATGTVAAQKITLRLHNFNSPKAIANRMFMRPWAKEVAAESNGRLTVQVFPAMQLGGRPGDLYGQARDGVVDIVWTLPGYSPGRFPLTEVFELPFIAGDAPATSQALMELYHTRLRREYEDSQPLVFHATARGHIHTSKRAVRRLEDLRGLKLRAPSRASAAMLKALGAVPVGMPIPKVYEAMSRGVVDGTWIPWTIMQPFRLHEVTKYHTEVSLSSALFLMTMNTQAYRRLPKDLRSVIDRTTGMALAKRLGEMWQEDEKPGRETAVAFGHTMISMPPEEMARWRQATNKVTEAWIEKIDELGHRGAAIVADAKRLVAKYSQ